MSDQPGRCAIYGCGKPASPLPLVLPGTGITAHLCVEHRTEMLTPPPKRLVPR